MDYIGKWLVSLNIYTICQSMLGSATEINIVCSSSFSAPAIHIFLTLSHLSMLLVKTFSTWVQWGCFLDNQPNLCHFPFFFIFSSLSFYLDNLYFSQKPIQDRITVRHPFNHLNITNSRFPIPALCLVWLSRTCQKPFFNHQRNILVVWALSLQAPRYFYPRKPKQI